MEVSSIKQSYIRYTPIIVTACFILSTMLLFMMDTEYDIYFVNNFDKNTITLHGITVSMWKRCILFPLAVASIFPYVLTCKDKTEPQEAVNWIKLGLTLGITILFVTFTALPANPYHVDASIFEVISNALSPGKAYESIQSALGQYPILSGSAQNRALLTAPQSVLLAFVFCILVHVAEERNNCHIAATVSSFTFAFLGLQLLDPRIYGHKQLYLAVMYCGTALTISCASSIIKAYWPNLGKSILAGDEIRLRKVLLIFLLCVMAILILLLFGFIIDGSSLGSIGVFGSYLSVYDPYSLIFNDLFHSVYPCGIALLILYISSINFKKANSQIHPSKINRNSFLLPGLLLFLFYLNVVYMFVAEIGGNRIRDLWFSDYERILSVLYVVFAAYVLIPDWLRGKKHSFSKLRKLLPLFLMVYMGYIVSAFRAEIRLEAIIPDITEMPPDFGIPITYYVENYSDIWFFPCIACVIYAMYVLYDYGMKEKTKLYFIITLLLIILVHIPEYKLLEDSYISTISVLNVCIGLMAPLLFIAFGILEKRKAKAAGLSNE